MLLGHDLIIKNFKKLAEAKNLSHSYIFFGPEGVGKRITALSLANYLENGEFSYNEDKAQIFNDAILIQPNESKTIGIDEVRRIKEFLYMRPNVSLKRTVIIDEAEFLTTEAQNALLKITEEPPGSSLLILIERDPEILMPTLNSRLQKIYFTNLKIEEVRNWLAKEYLVSGVEAERLAKESFGSPGLALKMFKDEKFKEMYKLAERFLKLGRGERKDFLKELLEPEKFDILAFLDGVILELASSLPITNSVPTLRPIELRGTQRIYERDIELWHKVLELRRNISNFPLNPKLQLLGLLNYSNARY